LRCRQWGMIKSPTAAYLIQALLHTRTRMIKSQSSPALLRSTPKIALQV
jgi:hypothetical protein